MSQTNYLNRSIDEPSDSSTSNSKDDLIDKNIPSMNFINHKRATHQI